MAAGNSIIKTRMRFLVLWIFLAVAMGLPVSPALAEQDAMVRIERESTSQDAATAGMTIRVSGMGLEPAGHSGEQARLMARRAAIVDGYRRLAEARGKVLSSFTGKTYHESVSDFISGAVVVETRYYYDGHVEADMELPVEIGEAGRTLGVEGIRSTLHEAGLAVAEVEPERRRITREEWEELFRRRRAESASPEKFDSEETHSN